MHSLCLNVLLDKLKENWVVRRLETKLARTRLDWDCHSTQSTHALSVACSA